MTKLNTREEFRQEIEDDPAVLHALIDAIPELVTHPDIAFVQSECETFTNRVVEAMYQSWKFGRVTFSSRRVAELENEIEIATRIIEDPACQYLSEPLENRTELTDAAYRMVRQLRSLRYTGLSARMQQYIANVQGSLREAGYCQDGGKCHHGCGAENACHRRETKCFPLIVSMMNDDWTLPA